MKNIDSSEKDHPTLANQPAITRYFTLEIEAKSPKTDIWLADDGGSLVEKSVGKLNTGVLSGNDVVEFGLGTPVYPISLDKDLRIDEAELARGQTCARPVFTLPPA